MPAPMDPLNKAAKDLEAGNLKAAERALRKVLNTAPGHPHALYLSGLVSFRRNNLKLAVKQIGQAIQGNGTNPYYHFNLGEVLRTGGEARDAADSYRRCLDLKPDFAEAWFSLGIVLQMEGGLDEALDAYLRARPRMPGYAPLENNVGVLLRDLGRGEEALEHFETAASLAPGDFTTHNNLGSIYRDLGRLDEALGSFGRAIDLNPNEPTLLNNFAACLKNRDLVTADEAIVSHLETCLNSDGIDKQTLVPAALSVLEGRPAVSRALALAADGDAADFAEACRQALSIDTLITALLTGCVFATPGWERLLTRLRRVLFADADALPATSLADLAQQCFNNEYVFALSETEERDVAGLRRDVEMRLASDPEPSPALERNLLRLAMYVPLSELDGREWLLEAPAGAWSEPFRPVLARQLREVVEEQDIRPTIRSVSAHDDRVSAAVREMYEENPYPRWFTTAKRQARPAKAVLGRILPHVDPPDFADGPLHVMVAGCGTGKQAIDVATRYEDCRVLAIDLSLSSLSYAMRMAAKLGVTNIEFRQADILGLADLNERFHIIECAGVLHHVGPVLTAWSVLAGLLLPQGLMKIGLYSEAARRHVVAARRLIAEGGLSGDRRGHPAMPPGHSCPAPGRHRTHGRPQLRLFQHKHVPWTCFFMSRNTASPCPRSMTCWKPSASRSSVSRRICSH